MVATSASRAARARTPTYHHGSTAGATAPVMPMLNAVRTAKAMPLPSTAAVSTTTSDSVRSMLMTWRRVVPTRRSRANSRKRSETDMARVLTTAMAVKAMMRPIAT
ncbi:hypothetical protein GA0115252_100444 [Streptomyces sp. DfronAA-171]|nr:hypothetical protein GA0115252_100444 [Streptomyces sp. DfronAA-171]